MGREIGRGLPSNTGLVFHIGTTASHVWGPEVGHAPAAPKQDDRAGSSLRNKGVRNKNLLCLFFLT